MAGWTTLVQAETLAVALGRPDLVVLDCRFSLLDPNVGEQAYLRSHLPGAAYAHLERDLSDMGPHGEGRHPWPQADVLVSKLRSWGIDAHLTVMPVGAGVNPLLFAGEVAVLRRPWPR